MRARSSSLLNKSWNCDYVTAAWRLKKDEDEEFTLGNRKHEEEMIFPLTDVLCWIQQSAGPTLSFSRWQDAPLGEGAETLNVTWFLLSVCF